MAQTLIDTRMIENFDSDVGATTDVSSNTAHRDSDGTDHSFINQDVTTAGTPTFGITTLADSSQLSSAAAPTDPADIANKQYVDDNSGGAPEGTVVKSTGETEGTKFLREDGDGTSSWQIPSGSGDVSKVNTPLDNQVGVWTGDGTIEGTSGLTYDGTTLDLTGDITLTGTVDGIDIATDVAANSTFTATPSTVITAGTNLTWDGNTLNAAGGGTTNLSLGTLTATTMDVNSDTGTNATLVEADTTNAGLLGSDKWDEIVANSLKATNVITDLSLGTVTSTAMNVNSSDGTNATLTAANTTDAGVLSAAKWNNIVTNNSKVTNVTTNLSEGTSTTTTVDVNSSDGTNATLVSASTTRAGLLTKTKWDEIVANTTDSHAPNSDDQVASDFDHNDLSNIDAGDINHLTDAQVTALHSNATDHTQNTDTALGSGAVAADHGTGTTDEIINVCYGTSSTPPTASTTTEGTLYIQYTA